jgi:hypothetical protein
MGIANISKKGTFSKHIGFSWSIWMGELLRSNSKLFRHLPTPLVTAIFVLGSGWAINTGCLKIIKQL